MRWLAIVFFLGLAACDSNADAVKGVEYFQDSRTELCFASGYFSYWDHVSSVFTYVPCDQVPKALLKRI